MIVRHPEPVVPQGWIRGESLEIRKMGRYICIQQPIKPFNVGTIEDDVILTYPSRLEAFIFLDWWFS